MSFAALALSQNIVEGIELDLVRLRICWYIFDWLEVAKS